jgi:hypothetical protein
MRGSIFDRNPSLAPGCALPPAPAHRLEPDHPQRVAGVPVTGLVDADTSRRDSDGVQHRADSRTWTEPERLAFLRRVQRVDPRERRA